MKIKFNSDDNLPVNKPLKVLVLNMSLIFVMVVMI